MKATITIKQTYTVVIDGKPVDGNFTVQSDWENMIKLERQSPVGALIIHEPGRLGNVYDLLPKMLGGNMPNGAEFSFEAEVVCDQCLNLGKK